MTEDKEAQIAAIRAQINRAMRQYAEVLEILEPALIAWREAVLQWGQQLAEALRPMLRALLKWWIAYKREALYQRLLRWHVPRFLARFVADRWPWRWLPKP